LVGTKIGTLNYGAMDKLKSATEGIKYLLKIKKPQAFNPEAISKSTWLY
jgi:hypothetical protein